jgi:hypothetical protein
MNSFIDYSPVITAISSYTSKIIVTIRHEKTSSVSVNTSTIQLPSEFSLSEFSTQLSSPGLPVTTFSNHTLSLHRGFMLARSLMLMMEAIYSSETLAAFHQATWCYIPEDRTLSRLMNWKWAGIAQLVQWQAVGWTTGVRFLAGARDFLLLYSVQTGYGAHLASYPIGMGGGGLLPQE